MLKLIAKLIARPAVANWLIRRAQRTPYFHIASEGGDEVYMYRWWLFNAYPHGNDGAGRRYGDWLPSFRIHRIMREDRDRHMHDHPWNARTFILRGWYNEERQFDPPWMFHDDARNTIHRKAGDTAQLHFGEFHRIKEVSEGGAWTLFITWKKRGTWGFRVNGRKVPWRDYLGINDAPASTQQEKING